MQSLSLVQKIAVFALPVLFAVTLHEVAHGWVAWRLGDPTARALGRLSLNPLRHVDPIGTVLVPGILLAVGGFLFGWAKPVPVSPGRLRRPRRDMALVALAGPMANLVMAVIWALVARVALVYHGPLGDLAQPLAYMGLAGIAINTILMVLNLLPLPPLDGGRVLASLLPPALGARYNRIEPYGLVILIALLATDVLGKILGPPVQMVQGVLWSVAGLAG